MFQKCAVIILLIKFTFSNAYFLFNEVFFITFFWFNLTAKVAGENPRP